MEPSILSQTQSICPVCRKRIPARYRKEGSKVYFEKECKEHGDFRTLFWRDAQLFEEWPALSVHADPVKGKPARRGCPYDCGLCEEHEGASCTAVLEVTYRCNMNCPICFADTGKINQWEPDQAGVRRMLEAVWKTSGNCSIQFSGGEPTVREDLEDLLRMGKEMGFSHIQVNTNGLKLSQDPDYAARLKNAGADLIYLQFDGTDDAVYQAIRGRDLFEVKRRAIEHCAKAGLGVLLVPVVTPGVNDGKLGEIVDFAKKHMPAVKGIHFQPVSYFGRFPDQCPPDEARMGLGDLMQELERQTGGEMRLSDMVSRKRSDSHCSFSSVYYLDEEGQLRAITKEDRREDAPCEPGTNFPEKANQFTNEYWRMPKEQGKPRSRTAMGAFLRRLREYTLSVTGMGFQDVWNVDLARLRGCCVHVVTPDGNLTPLCAFHLTDAKGGHLYQVDLDGRLVCLQEEKNCGECE